MNCLDAQGTLAIMQRLHSNQPPSDNFDSNDGMPLAFRATDEFEKHFNGLQRSDPGSIPGPVIS